MACAILDAALPLDLSEKIMRTVHTENFKDVLCDIKSNVKCALEKAVYRGNCLFDVMDTHNAEVATDMWVDWQTLVVKFGTGKTYISHMHFEYPDEHEILIEGYVSSGLFKIDRLFYIDDRGRRFTNLESLLQDNKAFENLRTVINANGPKNVRIDKSYLSDKTWCNPEEVLRWSDTMLQNYGESNAFVINREHRMLWEH